MGSRPKQQQPSSTNAGPPASDARGPASARTTHHLAASLSDSGCASSEPTTMSADLSSSTSWTSAGKPNRSNLPGLTGATDVPPQRPGVVETPSGDDGQRRPVA